ncbi:membrane protein of ER body-like protein isoform X2 [Cannabis sativa]|uniref:membrane protein of ER body-like protein isoform X2 n=1 Tax=Cannabis sativa TaxID=3483 RepID=UPI0029CA1219|nr:membrane protein of ER body-like protein isoform X2 [Cannabis sativa]
MEVVKPWEDVEPETEELLSLKTRLPRQHIDSAVTTTNDDNADESSMEKNVNGNSNNGISHEGNGGDTKSLNGNHGLEDDVVDMTMSTGNPVDQILEFEANDDLNLPLSVASSHEIVSKDMMTSSNPYQEGNEIHFSRNDGTKTQHVEVDLKDKGVEAKLREKTTEELRELYLAKLCEEKPGPHEFYCPNCKTCITKVLVRDREVEIRPSTPAPPRSNRVQSSRCTSCLSFLLIPAGWFIPKWSHAADNDSDEEVAELPSYTLQDAPASHEQSNEAATSQPSAPKQSVVAREPARDNTKPEQNISRGGTWIDRLLPFNKTEIIPGHGTRPQLTEQLLPATTTPVTKPSPNDSAKDKAVENISDFQSPVPHDDKITFPDHSSGVTVNVITNPSTSETVTVTTTRGPEQHSEIETSEGPPEDVRTDSTTITITSERTPLIQQQRSPASWDIVKSIVYGGLAESLTSLGIVTSAASGNATTLNILGLALANLVGGLFIIGHNLWELKDDKSKIPSSDTDEHVDRYEEVLGKKENFALHALVAIISFIIFGLVPPLVYGFSFRESNDKDFKLAAVAAASLVCITILSIAKTYTLKTSKYIQTVTYYIAIGLAVSGASYLAGVLINRLLEKVTWLQSTSASALTLCARNSGNPAWQWQSL